MTDIKEQDFESDEVRELIGKSQDTTRKLRHEVGKVIIGQADVVEHLLITLLVGGHCLITGMPGTAKTLLVHTLADALGLTFRLESRITASKDWAEVSQSSSDWR